VERTEKLQGPLLVQVVERKQQIDIIHKNTLDRRRYHLGKVFNIAKVRLVLDREDEYRCESNFPFYESLQPETVAFLAGDKYGVLDLVTVSTVI